ncbi:type VI secretion system baseplate subunit TssF [Polyangium jinanense]|uniref:type VI secretion system baseplate subunit TssF n=1 Tax=Polyangium jinanense TaxID=2829994 RepID=UPI0023416B19|nr:type VI secretion system baseplate subunit TssF [Polyangium jinanense]MDC3953871.1 type VI secretion system baseplate subunit TssF [Polyangium jinanense]
MAEAETLNSLFLEELSALDAFAARREAEGALSLGAEDPDVRRILEAQAFFSARTRAAAQRATAAAVRRIAAGTLDELLVPAPASMMVECVVGEERVEPAILPRGTLFRAMSAEGKVGLFSMMRPLSILPIDVTGARLVEQSRRLFVRIRLRARRSWKNAATLSFYVRRLDDYRASLALHDALSRHLTRAFAVAGTDGPEIACRVSFGAPRASALEDGDDRGPLARIRSFFHLPEQELFVQVEVPQTRTAWDTLDLFLELDEEFPTSLSVSNDTFRLHVVPVENTWVDFGEPILWDGTRTSAPVRSPSPLLEGVEVAGVRGVYKATDRGLVPILPAALAQDGDTYEIEEGDGVTELRLSIDGAFEQPCKVLAEARFSQPVLWSASPGKLALGLQTRHLPGVSFRLVGSMRAPAESPLARDPARCLDVLSLRMRPSLGRRDLVGMLEILGASGDGAYRGFATLVDELDSREAPDPARRAGGIRRVYRLAVRQRTPEEAPLVRRLSAEIAALLDAWTEEPVDVEITTRPMAGQRALSGGTKA